MILNRSPNTLRSRVLRIAAVGLALAAVAACKPDADAPIIAGGPVETDEQWYRSMHADNVAALFEQSLPPAAIDRLRAGWDEIRQSDEEVSAEDREQFAKMMDDLTRADAEDRLYAQLEPSLVRMETELAAQLPLMVAMGTGFASAGIQENPELTEAQKKHALEAIGALAGWISGAPLADRDKARQAIAEVTGAARALDLPELEALRGLTLDQALDKLSIVSAALKAVFAVYGLDLNASLSEASFSLVEESGDSAIVRISYPLAANQLELEQSLVRVDDRWYSAELIEAVNSWDEGPQAPGDSDTEAN